MLANHAGPPQRVLSNFLHSFVNSSHGGIPFRPASLPALGLSQGEKQCIRDRSTIMARHFFADKNEDFINAQVWISIPVKPHNRVHIDIISFIKALVLNNLVLTFSVITNLCLKFYGIR